MRIIFIFDRDISCYPATHHSSACTKIGKWTVMFCVILVSILHLHTILIFYFGKVPTVCFFFFFFFICAPGLHLTENKNNIDLYKSFFLFFLVYYTEWLSKTKC